ncbi:MAG: hypothetical protein WCS94_21675 [Verrucomicrobiota bacterium]
MNPYLIKAAIPAACGCVGGTVGFFYTRYLIAGRELRELRIDRCRRFLAYLGRWQSDFQRAASADRFGDRFAATISTFGGEVYRVRSDFKGAQRKKFTALVSGVFQFNRAQNRSEPDADKKFLAAIDALASHIERA